MIHGHLRLNSDKIMLGTKVQNPTGCWTRPTDISEVQKENIHGHIYVLTDNDSFNAYEWREGSPCSIADVDPEFFYTFVRYLRLNKLENLVGLQVLEGYSQENLLEFILGNEAGTVMLQQSEANHGKMFRITGWSFNDEDGIITYNNSETHAATKKGTHQVFTGSKPHPNIRTVEDLRQILKDADILP